MSTPYDDPPTADATCPECGVDLVHHRCAARTRELNDAFRATPLSALRCILQGQLVITRGVAARGDDFFAQALAAVRAYSAFTPENDPWGEHDFGAVEVDGEKVFWKIDYRGPDEYLSLDPGDPEHTRRVLTILAEEY